MQSQNHCKRTLEDKLITGAIVMTLPIYAVGGLYITGSLLAWSIFALVLLRAFVVGNNPFAQLPLTIWAWVVGMLVMLVCLLIAHGEWSLGVAQTIKSAVGWAKGWALMALFTLLGAVINIEPQRFVRCVCIVAKHCAIFALVTFVLYIVGVPGHLFTSPLQIFGGAGGTFFEVSLYGVNPETGAGRWQFFAPWAPAAGFMACLFLIFSLLEKDAYWRNWALIGCVLMALLCQSRAGWVIFVMIVPMMLGARFMLNPWALIALGISLPLLILLGEPVFEFLVDSHQRIKEARPESTRVRAALENIAYQRWQDEAPIWGHGIVEAGPKMVEFMPIGSHHSWYGLLFVKGIVGVVALAVPMVISAVVLLVNQHRNEYARAAFCMVVVLTCYSFFENLEILVYLYWPALFWLGLALRSLKRGEYVKAI